MIKKHGRYPYSSIISRPDYSWPDDKRLALYVALNVEVFSYGEGKGAGVAPPDQAHSDSVYSWRDYGNRVGIWRLLELFDELDMPFEAQMNTAIYDECPDIADALRARGTEILGHGTTNSNEQGHLPETLSSHRLDEPLVIKFEDNAGPTARSGLPILHGLDQRRSTILDENQKGSHSIDAIPD